MLNPINTEFTATRRSEPCLLRGVRKICFSFPVLIVFALIISDTLFACVVCAPILFVRVSPILSILVTLLFLICIAILVVSYLRAMFTSSAVRDNPPPLGLDTTRLQSCTKCGEFKPPRAHHCKICGECVLKMDHHCPWVSNCVGLRNYKLFLLFLFWVVVCALLYTIIIITSLSLEGADFVENKFGAAAYLGIIVSGFISFALGLSVAGFFGYHVQLIFSGETTIERLKAQSQPETSPYVKTRRENFEEIFGHNAWYWFLPVIELSETGYEFLDENRESRYQSPTVEDGEDSAGTKDGDKDVLGEDAGCDRDDDVAGHDDIMDDKGLLNGTHKTMVETTIGERVAPHVVPSDDEDD